MKRKEVILEILKQELPFSKEQFKVKRIGLFGSYIRDEQTRTSDIDLLVDTETPVGFFKFIELEDYLSDKLGVKIYLVTPDALKPIIKPHIRERPFIPENRNITLFSDFTQTACPAATQVQT